MKYFLALINFLIYSAVFCQAADFDTLRVMSYNLTNYGNNINPCTAANNGLTLKNPAFKTIVKHINPDVLGVCEMNTNPLIAGSFLSNVLNTDGVNHFVRSASVTEPSGTITSVLFYNSDKMGLAFQSKAQTVYRLTHHFRLYMKNDGLLQGDTIWLNVLLCHLKAGTATQDVTDRNSMALTIRNYLSSFPKKENCIIMGDFNFYRSSEAGFQTLTSTSPNPVYQFLDPVNRVGSWTSNSSFADVHTQCPRTDNNGGCYSGGGLDDRFDFIFMNRHLLNDSAGMRFIPGTYKAVGNDGQHYNSSINSSPANTSVPANVLSALYLASDHLPVVADLRVKGSFITRVGQEIASAKEMKLWFAEGFLMAEGFLSGEKAEAEILDYFGRRLWASVVQADEFARIALPMSLLEGHRIISLKKGKDRFGRLRFLGI